MSGWEFKNQNHWRDPFDSYICRQRIQPTKPPPPIYPHPSPAINQLKENAFYCICTTNSFRIFSNSDLVDKIMMVMIFMIAMMVMMFLMVMPYRNRLHPRSRVLWRAATIPKPHLLWPHPPEISGVSHDAFQIFTPKKVELNEGLRISCLKFWFQKWNRLKLWVNSPWLLWRRSPFMQEMAIQPLRQTFLIRDVCIAIYSMDPSVLFGFPCFWISTPGTFINQIYPISRWPCIQECPRKMRTFWLPETQCQCSPASMAFWFAGEGSQAFKHLN